MSTEIQQEAWDAFTVRSLTSAVWMEKAEFYDSDTALGEARTKSGELDFGVHWHMGAFEHGTLSDRYRVTWVRDTGELVVVTQQGSERYIVVFWAPEEDVIEGVLAGWAEECGKPFSLSWLLDRCEEYVRLWVNESLGKTAEDRRQVLRVMRDLHITEKGVEKEEHAYRQRVMKEGL